MPPQHKIRTFIVENFYVTNPESLVDSASLMDSGIIDSTGVLELITFIESEFNIQIANDEMVPANLDSVESIDAFVRRKLA